MERYTIALIWLAAWFFGLVAVLTLFDRMMDADARQQCAHPERLGLTIQQQAAACRQAGVTP